MKAFIEYLDYNLDGKLYNPCGDRSVVVLDGRNSLDTMINDAIRFNGYRRPKYKGFTIQFGDFKSSREVYRHIF